MEPARIQWHRVAGSAEELCPTENTIARVEIGGRPYCITRHDGNCYGFAGSCPHASGQLAEGFIDARGNVVCPVHGYRYRLSNGYNSSGEGYRLKVFPVELRPDGIYLGMDPLGPVGLP